MARKKWTKWRKFKLAFALLMLATGLAIILVPSWLATFVDMTNPYIQSWLDTNIPKIGQPQGPKFLKVD